MERKMKKNIKMAILVAFLGVFVACSSESTPTYSELGSDNYPQKFYVEYVPCTYGANWSPEAFNQDMLPGWQELQFRDIQVYFVQTSLNSMLLQ